MTGLVVGGGIIVAFCLIWLGYWLGTADVEANKAAARRSYAVGHRKGFSEAFDLSANHIHYQSHLGRYRGLPS